MWITPTQSSLTITWQLAQGCPCGILIQSHHQHCHMDNVLHMHLVRWGEPSVTIQLLTCWLAQGQTCELNRPKAVSPSHGNLPKVAHVEYLSKAIINTVTWTMCFTYLVIRQGEPSETIQLPHMLTCSRSNMWIKPTQGSLTITWQLAQGCPCGILIQSHHQHCHMDNVLHIPGHQTRGTLGDHPTPSHVDLLKVKHVN